MNGNTPPDHAAGELENVSRDENTAETAQTSCSTNVAPLSSEKVDHEPVIDPDTAVKADADVVNGGDDNASEAETLIDSPVKKKQMQQKQQQEQQQQSLEDGEEIKVERMPKQLHRIWSLPVPTSGDDGDDSAAVSPAPSTLMSVEKATQNNVPDQSKDHEMVDRDNDYRSESLSSARSSSSEDSMSDSGNRAMSEQADLTRNGNHFTNPRKRKHRASSVSLPNKRPSLNTAKGRVNGLNSEGNLRAGQSLSPKLRNHRRAASTQSVFQDDGTGEISHRKRRANTQQPGKDYKQARAAWEESDASSETTSHGKGDFRRPRRGIGRSTSTPGRPPGREHKRHINKYGLTKLAEACEEGDLHQVKAWIDRDPEQLEIAEFAGNTPLQIAALNGNVEVVDYLIEKGCNIDCANVDKDTPLIDAAENGHLDVVHNLLKAGVDPLRQNQKGQQALDVVTDEIDDATEIRAALRKAIEEWNSNGAREKREQEEEQRHRAGPSKELHFMARSYENLLKLVQNNDRNGVKEFLDARVPVDNAVIAMAAKTGDGYLVNMLLAEMDHKKALQKPELPMLNVLGTSHFEMVKTLTELEFFDPLYRNRQGQSWPEIADARHGPSWRLEVDLLRRLYNDRAALKERRSSSPVTKRESGKRRQQAAADDDDESDCDEEETAPLRNNGGRRLMSRKAMRANGKGNSDGSSEDESNDETATAAQTSEESSMKPPDSPFSKRTSPRSRTKSMSTPTSDSSPRTRRRSSVIRAVADQSLPTLEETAEDKEVILQREESERKAAEEKQRLEQERLDLEKAEAEAAAQRANEENARKAEEERVAAEAQRIEEARKAEEARNAEEDRIRTETEIARARDAHREEVLASLPTWISRALQTPDCSLAYLNQHFLPLMVYKDDWLTMQRDEFDNHSWVLNVTAAPLLGSRGVELMLRPGIPGYVGSLADRWTTQDLTPGASENMIRRLASMYYEHPNGPIARDEMGNSTISFVEERKRSQDAYNDNLALKKRLREGQAVLRYVRLSDVLNNLCPTMKDVEIIVNFSCLQPRPSNRYGVDHGNGLGGNVSQLPAPRSYVDGKGINSQAAMDWEQTMSVRPTFSK